MIRASGIIGYRAALAFENSIFQFLRKKASDPKKKTKEKRGDRKSLRQSKKLKNFVGFEPVVPGNLTDDSIDDLINKRLDRLCFCSCPVCLHSG